MPCVTTWRGFIGLGWFFHTWVGATMVVPAALAALVIGRVWWPTMLLVGYYSLRALFPRRSWPSVHDRLSRSLHSPGGRYFRSQRTVVTDNKPVVPDSRTMCSFHPHGILCVGWSVNGCMGRELGAASGLRWLGTGMLFKLPFISDALMWFNGRSADASSMKRLMREGKNVALIPGGFQEATLYARGEHRVFIKQRKGFIKYALRHGYAIRPVYTFGEELTYRAFRGCLKQRLALNKHNIPGVLFGSKYGPVMPNDDLDLVTVVGPALQLPTVAEPTNEQVAEWHAKYVTALQTLFDQHKAKHAAQGDKAVLHMF